MVEETDQDIELLRQELTDMNSENPNKQSNKNNILVKT